MPSRADAMLEQRMELFRGRREAVLREIRNTEQVLAVLDFKT